MASVDYELVGEAAGQYLSSTNLLLAIKNSKCSYMLKDEIDIDQTINEISYALDKEIENEFRKFIDGGELAADYENHHQYINESLAVFTEQLSESAACGIILGIGFTLHEFAKNEWEKISHALINLKDKIENTNYIDGEIRDILGNSLPLKAELIDDYVVISPTKSTFNKYINKDGNIVYSTIEPSCIEDGFAKSYLPQCYLSSPHSSVYEEIYSINKQQKQNEMNIKGINKTISNLSKSDEGVFSLMMLPLKLKLLRSLEDQKKKIQKSVENNEILKSKLKNNITP